MQETERKYEASAGASVALSDIMDLGTASTFALSATYFDTPDHRLTDARWVLRHREGGHDAGWHCKQPIAGDTRTERQFPDADRLPAELRADVNDAFGNVPLVPVAVLATDRTESPVLRDGVPVALVSDDRVAATASGRRVSWREYEVELTGAGDVGVLDEIERHLVAGGYRRSGRGSKISGALSDGPRFAAPTTPDAPARDVLLAYLGKQVGMLQALEHAVLVDAPDAVHKSRVATRRLRSLLRTYEPLLDAEWAEELRDELKWLAEALGAPRDAEVLREEFGVLFGELGAESLEGPVAERVLGHLGERHQRAHAALREAMAEPRYTALHARLVGLLLDAPWDARADAPAADVLPGLVEVARAKVARRVAKAERHPDDLERWHDVRKAAKAVRYCTEALVRAFGPDMKRVAQRWTEVTEAFGTLQDAAVARELLDEVGALAEAAGEPTETYGVLADIQDDRAAAALAEGKVAVLAALAG